MVGWNEEIKKSLKYCGENVFIGQNVVFTNPSEVVLGNNVRIDPFTLVTTALEVGNYIQICSHVVLGGGNQHKITLGNWNFIGYGSKLFCASEDYSGEYGPVNEFWGRNKIYRGDIVFEDYSGIASDVMVFPKVTIPIGCTIGAKSFIYTKNNLKEWSVFIGNPVKFHKLRNKENILKFSVDNEWLK
jgi:acetyltransferase-like isoleucine patch superfamily enzyme|tara:strand:- start:231 stop:791 length:561 start_codon:yes stop_codon:yes gene_type:complete